MEHQNPSLFDSNGNPLKPRALIQTVAAVDVSSVFFSDLGAFPRYVIEIDNLIPQADTTELFVRFSTAGILRAGASDYGWKNSTLHFGGGPSIQVDSIDSEIQVNFSTASIRFGNNIHEDADCTFFLDSLGSSTYFPKLRWEVLANSETSNPMHITGYAMYEGASSGLAKIDGIQFFFGGGNISNGTFRLYGQE